MQFRSGVKEAVPVWCDQLVLQLTLIKALWTSLTIHRPPRSTSGLHVPVGKPATRKSCFALVGLKAMQGSGQRERQHCALGSPLAICVSGRMHTGILKVA